MIWAFRWVLPGMCFRRHRAATKASPYQRATGSFGSIQAPAPTPASRSVWPERRTSQSRRCHPPLLRLSWFSLARACFLSFQKTKKKNNKNTTKKRNIRKLFFFILSISVLVLSLLLIFSFFLHHHRYLGLARMACRSRLGFRTS
jgi:hypothetical protein